MCQQEASDVQPDYRPQTVNTDGWAAWQQLFTLIVVIRCFLHGWLNIRARGKHLKELFGALGDKV